MNIKIEGNYYLKSDPRNVILTECKETEKGVKYDSPIGYYGTAEQALVGYMNYKINTSAATSINELLEEIRDVKKIIKEKLFEIKNI